MPKAQIVAVLQLQLGEALEQLRFLRVAAGEAGLDEVDAERVERPHHVHLLADRERHALALMPSRKVVS